MIFKLKSFEELENSELYEILKARNEVFVLEQGIDYQDCDDKDKRAYHLFAEDCGKVIAYLRILKKGVSYQEISIGRVLVKKHFRKKGLGKEIMNEAIKFITDGLKEKKVRISAQKYLERFYWELGFATISEEYIEEDIPHIKMLLEF